MKKLLKLAGAALALGALLVSCASGAKSSAGAGIPHPRSYVLDPFDAGEVWQMPKNQYGPNYQSLKDTSHYSLVKANKPQAGDTVEIRMKFTSDIDINVPLVCSITDQSAAANYWTVLGEADVLVAESVTAGVPVEFSYDYLLSTNVIGDFTLAFVYDESVGSAAKLTFEKVADSTDTSNEVVAAPHVSTRDIAIEKYAAFFEVATNHPWINGAQDMSVISNYQGVADISNLYGEDLPVAGDTLNVTWRAKSNVDLPKLYIRVIDNSSAANWWKELDVNVGDGVLLIEDIKANETFEASTTITFGDDAVGAVALCIWYDVEDAGYPAIITLSRD